MAKKKVRDPDLFTTAPAGTLRFCVIRCGYLEHTVRCPVGEWVFERWGEGANGERSPGSWFRCPDHGTGTLVAYEFRVGWE